MSNILKSAAFQIHWVSNPLELLFTHSEKSDEAALFRVEAEQFI